MPHLTTVKPFVTIVTPVYNGEAYLTECIQSVLNQTYQHREYVIVNNCSTDSTLSIAARYAALDPRIRVITNHAFLSLIDNHHNALRMMSPAAAYCKILCADDWLYPECLDEMVNLGEAFPSVGIISSYTITGTAVRWLGVPVSMLSVITTHKGSNIINIMLAADSAYAMPLCVAMCSAARNCNPEWEMVFFVFQEGYGAQFKQRIEASLSRTGGSRAQIIWIEGPLEELGSFSEHSYYTRVSYARLLMDRLIPPETNRLLYLDADVVVLDDIAELWRADLGDNVVGTVQDRIGVVSEPRGVATFRELGMPEDAKYFNSGVQLVDLARWREGNIGLATLRYLELYSNICQMGRSGGAEWRSVEQVEPTSFSMELAGRMAALR